MIAIIIREILGLLLTIGAVERQPPPADPWTGVAPPRYRRGPDRAATMYGSRDPRGW